MLTYQIFNHKKDISIPSVIILIDKNIKLIKYSRLRKNGKGKKWKLEKIIKISPNGLKRRLGIFRRYVGIIFTI